jgi:hypothetical protein
MKKVSISNFSEGLKLTDKQLVTISGGSNDNNDHDDPILGKPLRPLRPIRPPGSGTGTGSGN